MPLKLLTLFALALSLQAEDIGAGINCNSVETCKVAIDAKAKELDAKINALQATLNKLQQKLTIYQQSAFRCQDAMLDAQIDAQAKQQAQLPRLAPAKPQGEQK